MLLFLVGCNNSDDTSLKCTNCGEPIAADAKFCPQCGETILNSSDDDNDGEQCSHSWKTATCTEAKTCSKCGETEGNALGHTTTTGVCDRCNVRQGWSKNEIQSLIKVYDVFVSDIDSADGVDMKIAWENTSSKAIKYIYFSVEAYNAVNDRVPCEIRDSCKFTAELTGPFESGYSSLVYDSWDDEYAVNNVFENCYYNANIRYFELTNIRIVFMDNTELEIDEEYVEYTFEEIPQGLVYTWNDEFNGYEVNYRLKDTCTDTTITIPSTYNNAKVVSVADKAFSEMSDLEAIVLPDSIKHIGFYAFYDSDSLISVFITDLSAWCKISFESNFSNPLSNGANLYLDKKLLTELNLPDSITNIKDYSFFNCKSIESIVIHDNVTAIGENAFYNCPIKNATIPTIAISAIKNEDIEKVTITSGTTIEKSAFRYCESLVSIELSDSVKSIESDAFLNCTSLSSVELGNSVMSIGSYAFYDCSSLKSVEFPNSVISVGNAAFSGCTALSSIKIPSNVTTIGDNAFSDCTSLSNLEIGEKVSTIGNDAFYNCNLLSSVVIPNSVTSIGSDAFAYCTSLIDVEIGNGVTSMGIRSFYCCPIENATIPTIAIEHITNDNLITVTISSGDIIEEAAFFDLASLKSVIIGDTVTTIDDRAFYYNDELEIVVIGNNVTIVGENAFYECKSLRDITIGENVKTIGNYAFAYCVSLTNITIPKNVENIGSSAFYCCYSLVEVCNKTSLNITAGTSDYGCIGSYAIHIISDESLSAIKYEGDYIFFDNGVDVYLVEYIGNDSNLILPNYNENSYGIWNHAFKSNENITSVTIPEGVTSIGNYAFKECTSLINVIVPDSIVLVGTSAFDECTSLKYNEYDNAFYIGNTINPYVVLIQANSKSITSCNISEGVKIIYDYAFYNCASLKNVVIPDSVTSIGSWSFAKCTSLKNINMPDHVINIYSYAFADCSSITSVVIPNTVVYMGRGVFNNCDELKIYCEYNSKPEIWDVYWNVYGYSVVHGNLYLEIIWGYTGN